MGMMFLAIPLSIFVVFVLPLWLWLYYRQRGEGTPQQTQQLVQLAQEAKALRERVNTLEQILDAQHPNWRQP